MRALLVVVFLGACNPAAPAPPFILRIAVSGPLDKVAPDASSWAVVAKVLVYQRLVGVVQAGEIAPVLAAKVEDAGPDALRVWLRPGARFSDGNPVTFAEVAGSLEGSPLHATDEGESIVIRSDGGPVPTELLLSQIFVFRRDGDRLLGSGSFVVREEDATHVLLTRLHPAPGLIDRVLLNSYPTQQDAFAHTLKGDADLLPEVQPRWIEFFEGVHRLRILRANGNLGNMIAFNSRRLSREERVALTGLLASNEIRLLAFGSDCTSPARRPGIEPLPAGRALDVLSVPLFDRFAATVRRALGPRGGSIREVQVQEFSSAVQGGDYDLATIRPAIWPPLMATLIWRTGSPSNIFRYSNAAVDAALDARDWKAAQRALEADPPAAFVCNQPSVVVLDARLQTPALGAGGFFESLPEWQMRP